MFSGWILTSNDPIFWEGVVMKIVNLYRLNEPSHSITSGQRNCMNDIISIMMLCMCHPITVLKVAGVTTSVLSKDKVNQ